MQQSIHLKRRGNGLTFHFPFLDCTGRTMRRSLLSHNPFIRTYLHVIHWLQTLYNSWTQPFQIGHKPNFTSHATRLHATSKHRVPRLLEDSLHAIDVLNVIAQFTTRAEFLLRNFMILRLGVFKYSGPKNLGMPNVSI